ncbi:MAG: TRAP transporter substrate-binding protein [Pseudorhodoplanes sp.]|nr:TRAP transporter substrate-binding protein [Pseudorhodoplanes sp.]MCZ7642691.1 TRAP transporter substrate-binding protein [Pseudorhodoplanes sp.]
MTVHRRQFLKFAGAAVAAPAVARSVFAQAPQVTLKMHHFLPPVSNVHSKLLVPWAKKIETESGGRLKIDIFPSMQLGGTPPQLYDQARDGVADITWTLPGSTPGRFPKIEVFELPFIADKRGVPNAKAVQEFYELNLRDEFKEVHPICVWAHDAGLVHASRQIKTMDDLKGLKLRSPTRLAGDALKALGANGIPMPIPQVPEALAQKVIDGCVVPWEVVPAIKVHELVKFHTDIGGSPTLYTATFIIGMNKAKYDSLPADLKKVLDANSGQSFAAAAGKMWDDAGAVVEDMVKKRGNTITVLARDEAARWDKATQPVVEAWLKQAKDKGLNGEKLVADAKALLAKYANA